MYDCAYLTRMDALESWARSEPATPSRRFVSLDKKGPEVLPRLALAPTPD